MWGKILLAFVPVALTLIGKYMDHKDKEDNAVKAYYRFLEALQAKPSESARLRKSISDQKQRILEKINSG